DNISLLNWDRLANEIRLHDIVRRALAARLPEPAAVHRKLIDHWGDPFRLPHDYAWRRFGWHCALADDRDRLLRLLFDIDWLKAKLAATDINSLVDEFDNVHSEPLAKWLQDASRRSAAILANDASQLAGHLLARIPEGEKLLRGKILAGALKLREPWL